MNRLAYIESLLDSNHLPDERRAELEAEANDLANRITISQEKARVVKEAAIKRQEEIKALYAAGDVSVIDLFGIPEFGSDYEVTKEGDTFIVYSKVAGDDQNSRHLFESAVEATRKFRKLVWDRLYHKYVRTGEVDSLNQLAI